MTIQSAERIGFQEIFHPTESYKTNDTSLGDLTTTSSSTSKYAGYDGTFCFEERGSCFSSNIKRAQTKGLLVSTIARANAIEKQTTHYALVDYQHNRRRKHRRASSTFVQVRPPTKSNLVGSLETFELHCHHVWLGLVRTLLTFAHPPLCKTIAFSINASKSRCGVAAPRVHLRQDQNRALLRSSWCITRIMLQLNRSLASGSSGSKTDSDDKLLPGLEIMFRVVDLLLIASERNRLFDYSGWIRGRYVCRIAMKEKQREKRQRKGREREREKSKVQQTEKRAIAGSLDRDLVPTTQGLPFDRFHRAIVSSAIERKMAITRREKKKVDNDVERRHTVDIHGRISRDDPRCVIPLGNGLKAFSGVGGVASNGVGIRRSSSTNEREGIPGEEWVGSRISAVLAFDCRARGTSGKCTARFSRNGKWLGRDADGMRCLRMDACLSPSAAPGDLPVSPLERA
ncbi:hypothetical protein WH47_07997 [Habropoda laboriosa]|uniref:Uncharacterized protein n=1 Tax=Habropoda laboriosa TaxID=597456 RepID=A0A0L7QPD9_9HYME|nr:hypothetical protein WH47_07997 [Habropoda laboriosa]